MAQLTQNHILTCNHRFVNALLNILRAQLCKNKKKFNWPQDSFGWKRVTHGDQLASNQYVMMKTFTCWVVKLNVEVSGFPPTSYWVPRYKKEALKLIMDLCCHGRQSVNVKELILHLYQLRLYVGICARQRLINCSRPNCMQIISHPWLRPLFLQAEQL